MPVHRRFHEWLTIVALAALLGACGSSNSGQVNVVTIGEADDPFESGVHLSLAGQLSRAATTEGLVSFDEQGRVIPALADRWIVTDDGKSYIFRLRDGTWQSGDQITARSAVVALRRAMRALRGTSLGLDLNGIDEIRDMAGRVIEIRLSRPMPHFLQLLAQPELGLTFGSEGAGPMQLEQDGDVAVLTLIKPEELGLPAIADWDKRARPIRLVSLPGEEAVDRFNHAEADLVLGGRIGDFPLTRSVGILRGTIQLDPVIGLFGLHVMNTKGFLSEAANRESIAMAIDREELIAPFGLGGWTPSTRIVPAGLEGDTGTVDERWADMTFEDRVALASARTAQWRSGQEGNPPVKLSIWLPEGTGGEILFKRMAGDLAAVGIEAERAKPGATGDLRLTDTVARYPRAAWFLNRLNCKVRRGACESKADKLVAEAAKVDEPDQRADLLAEAEAELTRANVFIPFGSPIRWSLVRGDVIGFSTNGWAWHPLMPMALRPK